MLLLPLIVQALALLSSFPLVDTPLLSSHDNAFYDGTTDVSISRFGFSPSFDLSTARVGSTPSFETSTTRFDSTSSLDPCECLVDFAVWNESGFCVDGGQPSISITLLLGIRFFACLFVGRFLGLCAFTVFGLCAICFSWLRVRSHGLRVAVHYCLRVCFSLGCTTLVIVGFLTIVIACLSAYIFIIMKHLGMLIKLSVNAPDHRLREQLIQYEEERQRRLAAEALILEDLHRLQHHNDLMNEHFPAPPYSVEPLPPPYTVDPPYSTGPPPEYSRAPPPTFRLSPYASCSRVHRRRR